MRVRGFLAVLALLGMIGGAGAVPSVVSFQGRLESAGAPFSGTAQFKFALLNPDGQIVWTNESGTGGALPTASVSLPVQAGRFNAPLGETAMGFAPLPPAAFQTNVRLRVWVSTNGGAFEQLAPDAPLATVPYAARADGAVTAGQANQAANADAVGGLPAASVARASFVAGFPSGLSGTGAVLSARWGDANMTGAPGTFVRFGAQAPVDVSSGLPSGKMELGDVVLRRALGTDRSWEANARTSRVLQRLTITLARESTTLVTWDFRNLIASGYEIRIGDDGQPFEEIALRPDSFQRTQAATKRLGGVPGIGVPVGYSAGAGALYTLQPVIASTVYPGYAVVSAGFSVPLSTSTGGGMVAGRPRAEPVLLRQNPTDDPLLYQWFSSFASKDFALRAAGKTLVPVEHLSPASVTGYDLRLADDGLPVEEYHIFGLLAAP